MTRNTELPVHPGRAWLSGDTEGELAKMAKALGHPARVRILRMLLENTRCICGEIVDRLPLAQSTVSQHLKVLKEAGLIEGEIEGPKTCYWVAADSLRKLKVLVAAL